MARMRRGFDRSKARRTNWLAQVQTFDLIAPGSFGGYTLWSSTVGELANYVEPTLTRIRGTILVDADLQVDQDLSNMQAALAINVGESSIGAFSDAQWTRDDIIWTALGGISGDGANIPGTDSVNVTRYGSWHHLQFDVDIKAQRILRDTQAVFLTVHNLNIPGGVDCAVTYALRALWKE